MSELCPQEVVPGDRREAVFLIGDDVLPFPLERAWPREGADQLALRGNRSTPG